MLGLTTSAYAPHVTSCAARNAERCCENSELHGAREELATPDCAYIYLSTTVAISEKGECFTDVECQRQCWKNSARPGELYVVAA